jgi:TMEM175 potassium channel family protein
VPRGPVATLVTVQNPVSAEELPLGRLEAFSDGVFAIAITLLVLELSVSDAAADHLLRAILDQWPSYLAYVTSFLTIGVFWLQHSAVTSALRAADATMYRLNLLVLLLASFLPFPTKLVGQFVDERDAERIAVVFYGLSLLALDLALTAFIRYAAEQRHLIKDHVTEETIDSAILHQPSYALYGGACLVGLVLPTVGVALFLAIALYLGIPGRTVRRVLRRARRS